MSLLNCNYELNSVFSPDGKEFYYKISTFSSEEKKQGKYFYVILVTKPYDHGVKFPEGYLFQGREGTEKGRYQNFKMNIEPDKNQFMIPENLK